MMKSVRMVGLTALCLIHSNQIRNELQDDLKKQASKEATDLWRQLERKWSQLENNEFRDE